MRTRVTSLALAAGLATGLGGVGIKDAQAQTRTWRNAANGIFSTGTNWVGNVAPGAANPAVFGLNASVSPFTVTFTGNAATAGLTVSNQRPTFALGGFTYDITGDTLIGGANGPVVTMTNGTLNTRAGGGRLSVGNNAGQTGTLIVNGGVLNGLGDVGKFGTGTVVIQNGATVAVGTDQTLVLGDFPGSSGTVSVAGAGTSLTQTQQPTFVGNVGTGTLNLLNGATFTTPEVRVGSAGGTGTVSVESGATATITGQINLGGSNANNLGVLTVRGAGSLLSGNSLVTYGGGRGDITIESGGRLELSDATNAWDAGTRQFWRVSGEGSSLMLGGNSRLSSNASAATMTIESGADVTVSWLALTDYSSSAVGTMVIDGVGTTFSVTQSFSMFSGTSSLQLSGGATMNVALNFNAGCCNYGGSSQISLSGVGTTLRVGLDFDLGRPNHPGTMTVSQGAKLIGDEVGQSMFLYLGGQGTGVLNVDGTGSEIRIKNQLRLGWYDGNSSATFNLTNGASATVGSLTMLGGTDSTSTATIGSASLLSSLGWVQVYADSTLNVNSGGGVEALGGLDIRGTQAHPAEVVVGADSYFFATERIGLGNNAPFTEVGLLTLDGGTVFTLDYMPINDYGILRGTGNFEGNIGVNGTVQPGLPIGLLNVTSIGFVADRQATLDIQIGGTTVGTQYDRLAVTNNATLSGTLALSLTNSFVPTIGQTFDVLTAGSISGQFSTITGSDLGSGKAFVVQYLPTAVRLVVNGVTGVDIAQPTLRVVEGYTESLTAAATYSASPSQNVTSAVTWSSDNPGIATVSSDGKVTGVSGGTTTIRATYSGFQDTVQVTIRDLPKLQNATPGLVDTSRDGGLLEFDLLTPFLTTSKSSIQFDGGEANVLSGRTTWYGARFTGRLIISTSGDYSFQAGADDVVSVWVDGSPVAFGRVYQNRPAVTVTLSAGEHDIRVDYAQLDNEGSWMGVDWWGPGVPTQRITSGFLVGGQATLEFFDAPAYPFANAVPDLDQFHVWKEDAILDLNLPLYPGGYDASMRRYEGDIAMPDSGDYTFTVNVDDGAKVWLDGVEVLNAWSSFAFGINHTFTRTLERGVLPIRVDFTQHQGHYGGLVLSVEGPGITKQVVPAAAFSFGGTAPTCPADFDGDGTADFFDYDAFVICFEGGTCPPGKTADFDGDGTVDFFDYDAFVVAFETGC